MKTHRPLFVNDVYIIIHPKLDKEGTWTKELQLSIAHSNMSKLKREDQEGILDIATLGCAAINSLSGNDWLIEFLEDEMDNYSNFMNLQSKGKKLYEVKDNIIKLNFKTKTEGEA